VIEKHALQQPRRAHVAEESTMEAQAIGVIRDLACLIGARLRASMPET
jgi:hypothetical protein